MKKCLNCGVESDGKLYFLRRWQLWCCDVLKQRTKLGQYWLNRQYHKLNSCLSE